MEVRYRPERWFSTVSVGGASEQRYSRVDKFDKSLWFSVMQFLV